MDLSSVVLSIQLYDYTSGCFTKPSLNLSPTHKCHLGLYKLYGIYMFMSLCYSDSTDKNCVFLTELFHV